VAIQLRCQENELPLIATRYQYPLQEIELLRLRPIILDRGWMTKDELRTIALWKAPRSAGHVETNSDEYVKEITEFALRATTERARIEILTNLDGVRWPTASVILHFFHRDPYPIMDFRALWSVSLPVPVQYGFSFWWPYVGFCRELSVRTGLDMRTLDRALWQYSKENQRDA
jgi:hypothetical protein